ncbi:hypothetical protein [Sandaracinus amylolyticus]|uniref:Regulator protein n=1 Tax=Sandaracinus amylolyticus TaxID=927083 RepID=A0A0F6SG51_9BACT|nr:hypothetical protein [Sandaracinus amylolyticus]AKF08084.1 Regulator protein [Sandaracinus amylolyticus]
MNATELLSDRARDVRALLDAVESTDDQLRLRDLASRLAAHLRVEEEILFPLARTSGDLEDRTVSAEVLRRMSAPGADHAKLSRVMELAEARLDGAYDAYDDLLHHAIDDATLERIGDALAARFEDGVRGTTRGLRTGARRAPQRRARPMRAAARRR